MRQGLGVLALAYCALTAPTPAAWAETRALVVKSLGEHWSVGGTAIALSSTFQNYDLRTRFAPGIEYDLLPYSESTRRIFTLFYSVGLQAADYQEETVYGKTSETLLDHSF